MIFSMPGCTRQKVKSDYPHNGGTMYILACGHGVWRYGPYMAYVNMPCQTGPCYRMQRAMGDLC